MKQRVDMKAQTRTLLDEKHINGQVDYDFCGI